MACFYPKRKYFEWGVKILRYSRLCCSTWSWCCWSRAPSAWRRRRDWWTDPIASPSSSWSACQHLHQTDENIILEMQWSFVQKLDTSWASGIVQSHLEVWNWTESNLYVTWPRIKNALKLFDGKRSKSMSLALQVLESLLNCLVLFLCNIQLGDRIKNRWELIFILLPTTIE